jgi:hypothetical protein
MIGASSSVVIEPLAGALEDVRVRRGRDCLTEQRRVGRVRRSDDLSRHVVQAPQAPKIRRRPRDNTYQSFTVSHSCFALVTDS